MLVSRPMMARTVKFAERPYVLTIKFSQPKVKQIAASAVTLLHTVSASFVRRWPDLLKIAIVQ